MSYFETTINFVNESFVEIETNNESVHDLLSDTFTFEVENAIYSKKHIRNGGLWDGKIRLYDRKNRRIYRGIVKDIYRLLRSKDVGKIKQSGYFKPEDKTKLFAEWYESIKDTLPFEPYDYQYRAAIESLNEERALILSPTSSGKSYIFYLISRFLIETNQLEDGILVVVPSIMLLNQLSDDLIEYGMPPEYIQKIRGKKGRDFDKITFTTWHSIKDESKTFFRKFSAVLVDEVHGATANSLKHIMESCTKAYFRIGMTGTLKEAKCDILVLKGLFGTKIIETIDHEEMMDRGIAARLKILMAGVNYDRIKDNQNFSVRKDYEGQIKILMSIKGRDKFASRICSKHPNENVIILHKYKKHGKRIADHLREEFPDREIFEINGSVDEKERDAIKKYIDTCVGEKRGVILVATLGTLSTGVSIKNLDVGIIFTPIKSTITVMQTIGRLMRVSMTKKFALIYDVWDDLPFLRGKSYCREHAEHRMDKYLEAGIDVDETELKF